MAKTLSALLPCFNTNIACGCQKLSSFCSCVILVNIPCGCQVSSVIASAHVCDPSFECSGSTAGFFLGDGAGVGKGRQIAAMIKEHHAQGGKRTLWLSVSNDLRFDAERDLADVGAEEIAVFPKVCCCWSLNKVF